MMIRWDHTNLGDEIVLQKQDTEFLAAIPQHLANACDLQLMQGKFLQFIN
jgi:hypothetical protein